MGFLWKVLDKARANWRSALANRGDQVLGQAQDPNSLNILTQDGAPAPNYAGGIVYDITANQAAPGTPAAGTIMGTEHWGRAAITLGQTGGTPTVTDIKVWAEAGDDKDGAAIGWILIATLTVAYQAEAFVDIGQRRTYLEVAGYSGPGTVKFRMAPVA